VPRKSRLSLISERPMVDPNAAQAAAEALEAEEHNYQLAPPEDIVMELRRQNAELSRLTSQAIERGNQQEARAAQAEAELTRVSADRSQIQQTAQGEVEKARAQAAAVVTQAQQAIAEVQQRSAVAEKTAVVAEHIRQTAGVLGTLVSFLTDRAPVLFTMIGAYLLAHDSLPNPDVFRLALLAIYGCAAVLPAVWYSLRRG